MATVSFYHDSFLKKGISRQQLIDTMTHIGMEVERSTDDQITLDITANRPDLYDFNGIVRAVNLFTQTDKPMRYMVASQPAAQIKVSDAVRQIRPHIQALVARHVHLDEQALRYLVDFTEKICETLGRKRRKVAIGLHNFDAIQGPLTYDAASDKAIIPLNSTKHIDFQQVLKTHQKGKEYDHTIPNNGYIPYLEDSKGVIAMIPIINCDRTKVSTNTTTILIDVTGTSDTAVTTIINMLACSLIETGAQISPCTITYQNGKLTTPKLQSKQITVEMDQVSSTIGVDIPITRAPSLAAMMGHIAFRKSGKLIVTTPPYRSDILNWQDIAEDIAIAYGYHNIEPVPIAGYLSGMPSRQSQQLDKLSTIMTGLGYLEAINTYLTNEQVLFTNMLLKPDQKQLVKVSYSKSEVFTILRSAILPQLLQNLAASAHEKMPQRLFEAGEVFWIEKARVVDKLHLAFASEHAKSNYAEARAALDALMKLLAVDYQLDQLDDPSFIEGRCAEITVNGKKVGRIGEINPEVLINFKLEEPVCACEVELTDLIS